MVDAFGRWTEEADYSKYPMSKWCDLDYVAKYIREQNYKPELDMEELIERIIYRFNEEQGYEPHYGGDLMIYMPTFAAFVEDMGGVKEFDYNA